MGYNKKINVAKNLVLVIALLMTATLLMSGCTDTLKGELNPNQLPIVEFVNIPPDGQNFSRNAEVHWIGYDRDGQIDYYRYYVAKGSEIVGTPNEYAGSLNDTMWVYIDVSPTESDPKTTNVIPLTADLNDPVNTFVQQYIFLQAFDLEGGASDIIYKVLNRNDNPPETNIFSIAARVPFVNSVLPGGIITGIKIDWEGSDIRDYEELGLIPPPFEYEWRLFGPFSPEDSTNIYDNYVKYVFVTEDARIFDIGDTLIQCDTSLVDVGGSTVIEETCDTTVFTLSTPNTPFYTRDTVIDVTASIFTDNLVTNSQIENNDPDGWVYDTKDTIYNAYRYFSSDTTVEKQFIFWVRSRDDAYVADVTPEFKIFPVIDPQYERTLMVIDFTRKNAPFLTTYLNLDTAKAFWYNTIQDWFDVFASSVDDSLVFDTTRNPANLSPSDGSSQDFIVQKFNRQGIPISTLLKHKILILYNEDVFASGFTGTDARTIDHPEIFQAIDAGINVWATWRAPLGGGLTQPIDYRTYTAPYLYEYYFGVEEMSYSAWFNYAFGRASNIDGPTRIDDFIGAYSLDESAWPKIEIDTALLHSRFQWSGNGAFDSYIYWDENIASLPEVDWSVRSFGTDVMYLYQSRFGSDHPQGFDLSYEGSPVGHRKQTNLFKTVHLNFTTLVVKPDQAQELANNILTWLYPEDLGGDEPVMISEDRYDDGKVYITLDQARKVSDQRNEAREPKDGE